MTGVDSKGEASKAKRDPLFDVVKFLMMVWVVFLHVASWHLTEPGYVPCWLDNAMIGVNMPVFFVMAGCFAYSTFSKSSVAKLCARTICLIWPQIVLASFFAGLLLLCTGDFSSSGRILRTILGFWYLKVFAVIYGLSWIIFKLTRTDWQRWCVFVLVYVVLVFDPGSIREGRVYCVFAPNLMHMLPYYVFGLLVLSRNQIFRNRWVTVGCGIVFISVSLFQGNSLENGMNFWVANTNWKDIVSIPSVCITFFGRTIVGIAGSIALLGGVDALLRVMPNFKRLAVFGTTSLGVYILHCSLLALISQTITTTIFPGWSRMIVALLLFMLCHMLVSFAKRCSLVWRIVFGDENAVAGLIQRVRGMSRIICPKV